MASTSIPERAAGTQGTSTQDGVIRNREADIASLAEGPWDGRNYGYIPEPDLKIDPSLKLHQDFDIDLDPITYQVLRNRFWNLNLDHSDTIKRVSGSPLIVYMDDFNTSLLTENGDTLVCGPSIQYFTGHSDHAVKWTLENRSASPGIEEGDIFLHNDPYIGTAHQMDVAIYAPLFCDGKLFCWILSCCHVGDIGGTIPGSFVPDAPDIYSEPTPVPPIKLARGDVVQQDVADSFIRKSRLPDLLALQLRSQIAGIRSTRARMQELLDEHGPKIVKGAMRRLIRDCSVAVGERLSRIPDGRWEETVLLGSLGPEDKKAHRLVTSVEKRGDRLFFSNAGTDEQYMAANCTYSAWRAAIVCAVSSQLGWDQLYCPAGVVDHVELHPEPGLLNCATYPAAVSPGTCAIASVYSASQVVSKMLLSGPEELRNRANASGGVSLPGWWVAAGHDRNGRFVADLTGDSLNGAIGAFPFRDGVDTGGAWWWPRSVSGNAEEWEQSIPFMYLYRREQRDSGGPGRWRGGNGVEIAVIGHKTPDQMVAIISADPAVNASPGLAGGHPAHSGNYLSASETSLRKTFAEGRLPASREELEDTVPNLARVSPKALFPLLEHDVFVVEYSAGGGFGDPLERDPELVAADVASQRTTTHDAAHSYGVVVDAGGAVDKAATDERRTAAREARLKSVNGAAADRQGKVSLDAVEVEPWENLAVVAVDGQRVWACSSCGEGLGPASGNYKLAAATHDSDPHDADPVRYPEPSDFCDDPIVLRQFFCPGCGALFNTEICKTEDPPTWDLRIEEAAS
jgi:N-methylhydantoinase B